MTGAKLWIGAAVLSLIGGGLALEQVTILDPDNVGITLSVAAAMGLAAVGLAWRAGAVTKDNATRLERVESDVKEIKESVAANTRLLAKIEGRLERDR